MRRGVCTHTNPQPERERQGVFPCTRIPTLDDLLAFAYTPCKKGVIITPSEVYGVEKHAPLKTYTLLHDLEEEIAEKGKGIKLALPYASPRLVIRILLLDQPLSQAKSIPYAFHDEEAWERLEELLPKAERLLSLTLQTPRGLYVQGKNALHKRVRDILKNRERFPLELLRAVEYARTHGFPLTGPPYVEDYTSITYSK